MVVDSSLTVKDSVIMEDNLHIYEKLQLEKDAHLKKDVYVGNEIKVEGDVFLLKNAFIGKDLNVDGNSNFINDAYVGNVLKVEKETYLSGDVYLNQKVIIPNLNELDDFESKYILFTKEDGIVEKKLVFDVLGQVYTSPCKTDPNGDVPNPQWRNGLNKIFTPCPEINVGIGTDTPTHKLHTVGDVLFTNKLQIDGNVAIGTQPSNFSKLKIKNPGKSAGLEIDQTGNNQSFSKLLYLQYSNPTTEIIKVTNTVTNEVPFLLQANGAMTIHNGTQKTLQLNADGTLQARVIILDAYNWPDYVFKKNYDLMPLSKIKDYIEVNGHLPQVPSAQETAENGIDIAEMNKILLQKIEELTLHLIEQDERIKELEIRKSKD
jgi:hypothetical protein